MATRKRVVVPGHLGRAAARTGTGRRPHPGQRNASEVAGMIEGTRFAQEQGQGDFIPLTYEPTNTTWPSNGYDHRRTSAAGYNRSNGILRVEFFSDGAVYDYGMTKPVPPEIAYDFRKTDSPGVFINQVLNGYGYRRVN